MDNVIPLYSNGTSETYVPRHLAGALPRQWLRFPEPVQLYNLIVHTFETHIPGVRPGNCLVCGESWPCTKIRLAFRLREGF